jgi:hypothetical protein
MSSSEIAQRLGTLRRYVAREMLELDKEEGRSA